MIWTTTNLSVEQEAIGVANMSTGNMAKIQLKFVEHSGSDEQEVDLLSLNKFDGYLILDDSNVNFGVLGFPLKPGAPCVGLVRIHLDVAVLDVPNVPTDVFLSFLPLDTLSAAPLFLHQYLQLVHCSPKFFDVLNSISHN